MRAVSLLYGFENGRYFLNELVSESLMVCVQQFKDLQHEDEAGLLLVEAVVEEGAYCVVILYQESENRLAWGSWGLMVVNLLCACFLEEYLVQSQPYRIRVML